MLFTSVVFILSSWINPFTNLYVSFQTFLCRFFYQNRFQHVPTNKSCPYFQDCWTIEFVCWESFGQLLWHHHGAHTKMVGPTWGREKKDVSYPNLWLFDTLDDFYVHMPTWCWQIYLTSWCKCLEYPLLVANIVPIIIFILELRISRSWYLDSCGTSMLWRFQQDVSRWSKKYRCSCNCQWLNGIEDPRNLIFVTQSPKASHFPMCFFVFSDGISVFFV